jgi:hypothetical protein
MLPENFAAALAETLEPYLARHGRAQQLCQELSQAIATPLRHESSDYSAEALVLWLDAKLQPTPPFSADGRYMVKTMLSSRGKYFTFVVYRGRIKAVWSRLAPADWPEGLTRYTQSLAQELEARSYVALAGKILDQSAPGHFTELDGNPATVFEALFGELD